MNTVDPVSCGSCRESKLCCSGRDSSCVVQKVQINTIIEDLSDKPCYCDHACLKLGDCCPDFKDACGVVDCLVTPWGPWSHCDVDCGTGRMMRSRTVQRQPENGGKHCPSLVQKRGCQVSPCPHTSRSAITETAMLLPATHPTNETNDIYRNPRYRNSQDPEQHREYCVQFEVLKVSKGCRKDSNYSSLKRGQFVCVHCEMQTLRKSQSYHCLGHGAEDHPTHWTSVSTPHCHGKWIRRRVTSPKHHNKNSLCPSCNRGPDFIFA
ncbi:somatomedin-B and thrombospondin type-1 domain-containing protein [Anabrus simplex]|uniref:somatomedin-B and thrombospondin type-1 domain-containing protein n=1 Tax=Anabrus simplex TaxID=316456 RepID=UPI0035A37199